MGKEGVIDVVSYIRTTKKDNREQSTRLRETREMQTREYRWLTEIREFKNRLRDRRRTIIVSTVVVERGGTSRKSATTTEEGLKLKRDERRGHTCGRLQPLPFVFVTYFSIVSCHQSQP